jgi:hypothetical protein
MFFKQLISRLRSITAGSKKSYISSIAKKAAIQINVCKSDTYNSMAKQA